MEVAMLLHKMALADGIPTSQVRTARCGGRRVRVCVCARAQVRACVGSEIGLFLVLEYE